MWLEANGRTRIALLLYAVWILVSMALFGCEARTCPPGTAKNATGDCVPFMPSGGDEDGISNPDIPTDTQQDIEMDELAEVDDDTDEMDSVDSDEEQIRTCTSDSFCRIGEVCHFDIEGGICLPPCEDDRFCKQYSEELFCNAEGRCKSAEQQTGCEEDSDCPLGEICHKDASSDGTCAAACSSNHDCMELGNDLICHNGGRCAPEHVGPCSLDEDCSIDEICHLQLNGGTCKTACGYDSDCPKYFICSSSGQCVRNPEYPPCSSDNECNVGMVCHTHAFTNGVCAPECESSQDCTQIDDALFCNSQGRCDIRPTGNGCTTDTQCEIGTICHTQVGEHGTCAPRCENDQSCHNFGDEYFCANDHRCKNEMPQQCSSDLQCPLGQLCHQTSTASVCGSMCSSNQDCAQFGENLFCNAEQRCIPYSGEGCNSDSECPYGKVCHSEIGEAGTCNEPCTTNEFCQSIGGEDFFCNPFNHCRNAANLNGCTEDADCEIGKVCHAEVGEQGTCASECTADEDCSQLGDGLFCNAEHRCVPDTTTYCTTDADCIGDDICHTELHNGDGICAPACTQSSQCQQLEAGTFCNAFGKCRPIHGAGCMEDADCPVFTVCHSEAVSGGICAAECSDDQFCHVISGNLYCNAEHRCVPESPVDGDEDSDEDIEPECMQIHPGATLGIELRTATLQLTLTYKGRTYTDPSGGSYVYLRDRESGNQFRVASNISDGSAIPPIKILRGTYDIIFQNSLGQRATVKELVDLNDDVNLEVELPIVDVSFSITKNGQPYPAMSEERCGKLILYDTAKRRENIVSNTIGCSAPEVMHIYVLDSRYDVIFRGWLSDADSNFQQITLINGRRISEDIHFDLNLDTATCNLTVSWNGAEFPSSPDMHGDIWAKDVFTGDIFPVAPANAGESVDIQREFVKDSYIFYYRPAFADDFDYGDPGEILCLEKISEQIDIVQDGAIPIDAQLVHIAGNITYRSQPMPDHEYQHRGYIVKVDPDTEEECPIADLGLVGPASFDTWIAPGTYDIKFHGPLIDSEYLQDRTWPKSARDETFMEGIEITEDDLNMDLDIPAKRIEGRFIINGEELTSVDEEDQFLYMRKHGSYSDIASFCFAAFDGPQFSIDSFAGTYDIRFQGDVFTPGQYQFFYIEKDFSIEDDLSHDFEINFRTLKFNLTINGVAISDLLASSLFTSAEIDAVDKTIHTRMIGSNELDENGQFSFLRPDGRYDFVVRLEQNDSFLEYPSITGVEIDADQTFSIDLPLETYRIEILLDSEALPDDENDRSRGDVLLRGKTNYYIVNTWDLGASGETSGILKAIPGTYTLNFQTGYASSVFPYPQWKSLGCVELLPQ